MIANAIAVDSAGAAYVAGMTYSSGFPTTPGAFDTSFNGPHSLADAFVTKLNASGSALVYSTFLGGTTADDDGPCDRGGQRGRGLRGRPDRFPPTFPRPRAPSTPASTAPSTTPS
jgi:hypothetical protein